jgi:hypothetical protein
MSANISHRRQIITLVLLVLALGGGLLRWWAPQPSLAHDMGSLLLVLWLPIIGNIIAFLVQRARTPRNLPAGFVPGSPFVASARIELTLMAADVPVESRPVRAGLFPCLIVLGAERVNAEAFSARLWVPAGSEPVPQVSQAMEIEFLRPALALAKLPAGTGFALLSGRTLLGQGRMLG